MSFDTRALTASQAAFGADLLRELCAAAPAKNVFTSPIGLFTALALAYNGAAGPTRAAMAAAMRLEGPPDHAALNAAFPPLLRGLAELDRDTADDVRFGKIVAPEEYKIWLQLACALWLAQGVPFVPDYLSRVRATYDAALESATDAATINAWVKEKTGGTIEAVVDKVEPLTSYLISAVYFRGGWAKPFSPDQTEDDPFHLLDGTDRALPMMRQTGKLPYAEDATCQTILLPIGDARDEQAECFFMVALPRPGLAFADFCAAATAQWWRERYVAALQNSHRYKGELHLPRFRIDFSAELSDALTAMGMGQAFSQEADFSALSPMPAMIKKVIHKTFLAVDEEGIRAGAASAVEMVSFGIPDYQPFTMVVDRPFLCAIVAARSSAWLFMGAVTSPEPA